MIRLTGFLLVVSSFFLTPLVFGSKGKYGSYATPLSKAFDYVKKTKAPDYWALASHYLSQQNERSCSIASLAMIINAFRNKLELKSSDELVTEKELFQKTDHSAWNRHMSTGPTIILEEMGSIVDKSLRTYGFVGKVEVVHTNDTSEKTLEKLRRDLLENEKSDKNFILVNFVQGVLTEDKGGGHFAPIAAYDAKKKSVLVFDPDRKWYEPYWVSDEMLLKAMAIKDRDAFRGYIKVSI